MIGFFRRIFSSKIGLFLTFCFVGLIAVAFATADVSGSGAFGGVTGSGTAAKVGNAELSTSELGASVNNAFRVEQRENTSLDLKTYVEGGGFDSVLERLINSVAIAAFGNEYGMTAGKRLVDSEIASIQAFQGANGQFSEENFRRALQQQGLKEQQLRADFSRNLLAEQLLPIAGFATAVPQNLIVPYASLLLETREGKIAVIPSAVFVDRAEPAEAALAAFYSQNGSNYTIPERRTISYALFDKSRFNERIKPTEEQIQGYYNLNKAQYAASEMRNVEQVILPTEAAAAALADTVKGGMSLAAAAQSVGLSAAEVGSITKTQFASSTSQAVADAAFRADNGGVSEPAQSALGWHVVKINGIDQNPGRTLDQARTEIIGVLTAEQIDEALAELTVQMEDAFADGSSLADVAAAEELAIQTTPKLLANGQNPEDQEYRPIPEMQRILPLAFSLEEDSDPQVVEILPGQQYAILDVTEIAPAAPPPLDSIRQQVAQDYILEQGSKKAKTVADEIAEKLSAGTPLAQAMSEAGVQLPRPDNIRATRAELARQSQQGQVPPPLTLMFSMAEGTAKTLRAPQNQGWFVVQLENIIEGDAASREDLLNATKQQFQQVFGNEYTEQFIQAMKADIGVERNDGAINTLKNQLVGRN